MTHSVEPGTLLWAKPADEDSAKSYLHRPAVVLEVRTHTCRVGFFNQSYDDTSAYLPGSVLALPIQWVQKSNCVDWDSGADELLRQKERHVKRILEERCQLWIVDTEYQRVRNVLLGKEQLPDSIRKSLSEDIVKRIRTKGRFTIHPVGRIRKISTISSRSGTSATSSDTEEPSPEPKRSRGTAVAKKQDATSVKVDTPSSSSVTDLDDSALRRQVMALTDAEIEAELVILRNAERMLQRLRDNDEGLLYDLSNSDELEFAHHLASLRLAISAIFSRELEKKLYPILLRIRESVIGRVKREWKSVSPVVREASLCIISLLEC